MKKTLAFLVILSSCATLPPAGDRQVTIIKESTGTKAQIHAAAVKYLAKNQGDSKAAMQANDPTAGTLITKGRIVCNVYRQGGDPNDYSVDFVLDFAAKDKKAKFSFENLSIVDKYGAAVPYAYNQIVDKAKLEGVKPCLNEIVNGVLETGRNTAGDW